MGYQISLNLPRTEGKSYRSGILEVNLAYHVVKCNLRDLYAVTGAGSVSISPILAMLIEMPTNIGFVEI
jgi:hypothetical protein